MKLSLVICTHNHLAALQQTLRDLAVLQPPRGGWELLIVDNASTDGTQAWLAENDWRLQQVACRAVREDKLGVAHARNRGVTEAAGEYVVFLDDDETPEPDWLVNLETVMELHLPAAIGGRIRVRLPIQGPNWLTGELLGFLGELDYGASERLLTEASTPIFTGNAAFHRTTLMEIGGFDPNLGRRGTVQSGGEDTDLYRRLVAGSRKVIWAPLAIIHHRIEPWKIKRGYFLSLHYRQGRMEGSRRRGGQRRLPPPYLIGQLWRAAQSAIRQRWQEGTASSLRKEMNVIYFVGYLIGWALDP